MIIKILIKFILFLRNLLPLNSINNHKYLNKNQVTNLIVIMNSLKNRGFYPSNIFDIGCFQGLWSKQILGVFSKSNFFLFDADSQNEKSLKKLKSNHSNLHYKIKLLSDDIKEYKFFRMQSGSSIYEEQTDYPRDIVYINSSTLSLEINDEIKKSNNNLIKIDSQGSEIKILKGLGQFINSFEVVILEVSLHQYNRDAPLFNEINEFMISKDFRLYDIFDLKRLGNNKSFLVQFDCVFIRRDSNLLNVKF